MTLKFGFLNIPCGGAKAGIIASSSLSKEKRRQVLLGFGKSLGPLLLSGIYRPGTDMGTSPEDLYYIWRGAGRKVRPEVFQNTESGYYAALTVFITAEKLIDYLGLSLPNCSVAIEGFGKLGLSVARLFSDACAKIVAISTIEGAIYNPEGLNISKLITLKNKFNDKVIANYRDAEMITKEELLTLDVDVLIPCAGPDTLNLANIPHLKAKIIVPGANIAATGEAENLMFERGIHYVPGFVSNCGEILKHFLLAQGLGEKDIQKMIKERFGRKISNLLEISYKRGIPLGRIARKISWQRVKNMEERRESDLRDKGLLLKMLTKLSRSNFLPYKITVMLKWFMKFMTNPYVNRTLPKDYKGDSSAI
jgi:glutamate dehydrogenase/leucine dehydrogenase